jgi:Fic family protein
MRMFAPKYTITNKILNQLTQIAEIKTMVERSRLLPAREAFLRRTAIIKMAHSSTSIEGNQLQEYQVEKLAQGKKIIAEKNQIKEVENYLTALKKVDSLAAIINSFTSQNILSIHRDVIVGLVDADKVGSWRKGPVYIVNVLPTHEEILRYTAPSYAQVPQLIEELLAWLKYSSDIHPIIRAAMFHYQFETIHPFTDGNGRTGRLLSLLHLYQSRWGFKKVLVLEDYYNQNRKNYYLHLQTGKTYEQRHGADLTKWLEYYIEGFLSEALVVKDHILKVSVVQPTPNQTILDKDELKIVDFVVSLGKITSTDVVNILRVPKRTAQFKLKKLEAKRVLVKINAGPKSYYTVNKGQKKS